MTDHQERTAGPEQDSDQHGPVIRDKRRLDPETGQLRQQAAADERSQDGDQPAGEQPAGEQPTGEQPAEHPDTVLAAERLEDLRRLQAEYLNYKRRVERDRNVATDNAIQSVLTALLPVLDDLDAARAAGDLTDGPFAAIATKFDSILAGFGLERQDQDALAGQPFDPSLHEAMLRQPSGEVPEEHIVQVFRNGYVREGRVLRAAQVMVSAGAEG